MQQAVVIELRGVSGDIKGNVELMLSLFQQRNDEALNKARVLRLYQRSFEEIKQAVAPFGYLQAKVTGQVIEEGSVLRVVYDIELAEPIKITRLNIKLDNEAANDQVFKQLLKNLPLKENHILDQRLYAEAKSKLQNLAASRGYFHAVFVESKILIDLDRYESDVVIILDSGKRYKFGEISITTTMPSKDLVQRYIKFKRGDYYSVSALIDLQVALNDSDYFNSVEITGLTDQVVGDEVPVEVMLEPRLTRRYSFGLGYGTDTGARGRIGLDAPLINAEGHKFDTSILVSELKDTFSFNYTIPILDPRTDQLTYSASYDDEETVTSRSMLYTLGVSISHARKLWRETVSLKYQEETFVVGKDMGQSTLLMPGIAWSRIWGKERIYTRKGASLSFDFRAANKYLLSDVDFIQSKMHAKLIRGLTPNSRVITRGTLGAIFANDFETIPSSVRFFAGGDNSVRGYKYNSLGPKDSAGVVTGGRAIMVGSIEFEHSIIEKWDGAVFYDVGNAVEFFDEPVEHGAGVGVRWKSPVGPMRLDVAFALSEPGTPWRIHLNLGPDL